MITSIASIHSLGVTIEAGLQSVQREKGQFQQSGVDQMRGIILGIDQSLVAGRSHMEHVEEIPTEIAAEDSLIESLLEGPLVVVGEMETGLQEGVGLSQSEEAF